MRLAAAAAVLEEYEDICDLFVTTAAAVATRLSVRVGK